MNAEKYVNCTPHSITIFTADGKGRLVYIPTSNFVVRVEQLPQKEIGHVSDFRIPIVEAPVYGDVTGLPDEATNIIVSLLVAQQLCENKTWPCAIYVPDTSPDGVVRDDNGQIVGTKRLVKYC